MNKLTRNLITGVATAGLLIGAAGSASADQVVNTIDNGVDDAREELIVAVGDTEDTTIWVKNENNNDGDPGNNCNLSGSGTSVTLSVTSADPTIATVSPAEITIHSCDEANGATVTVAGVANGTVDIDLAITAVTSSNGGSFDIAPAQFKAKVGTGVAAPSDTAAPEWSCTPDVAATDWQASEGTHSCTASDPSGLKAGSPASFTLATSVGAGNENGSASTNSQLLCDTLDNCTTAGPISGWKIDRKAPTNIQFTGDITDGASYYFGSVPADNMGCSADDGGSGLASCSVSGYLTTVGSHTLTATATDNVGNADSATISYSVLAWTPGGFYQPVDMDKVNTVKGGSTVPLKFEVFAGSTELTSTSVVDTFRASKTNCITGAGLGTDDIEEYTSGGTVLRYDGTGGQFIQNWQTPKGAGICYHVVLTLDDGSTIEADFKTK